MLPVKSVFERTLGLTDPFHELRRMHEDMDRMFASMWQKGDGFPMPTTGEWTPSIDMIEEKDRIVVRAELPGIDKKNVTLTLRENILTITGERKEEHVEKGENFLVREGTYGHFRRMLSLPCDVKSEAVKAEFESGVLMITLPKAEVTKTKEVKIGVN